MNSEKLGGGNTEAEKPDWKVEREQDLARKRKIGEVALGVAAAAFMLAHGMSGEEIMKGEESEKYVEKIKVEQVMFHDGVNARKEPVVDNTEPNVLASVGEDGDTIVVDYDGDAYYYNNENDVNGGWYGFEAAQLSDELLEGGYISLVEAKDIKSDERFGDGTVWFNENYVTVIEADENEPGADPTSEVIAGFGSES